MEVRMFGNKPQAEDTSAAVEAIAGPVTAGEAYALGLLTYKPLNPAEPVQGEWLTEEGRKALGFCDPNA